MTKTNDNVRTLLVRFLNARSAVRNGTDEHHVVQRRNVDALRAARAVLQHAIENAAPSDENARLYKHISRVPELGERTLADDVKERHAILRAQVQEEKEARAIDAKVRRLQAARLTTEQRAKALNFSVLGHSDHGAPGTPGMRTVACHNAECATATHTRRIEPLS